MIQVSSCPCMAAHLHHALPWVWDSQRPQVHLARKRAIGVIEKHHKIARGRRGYETGIAFVFALPSAQHIIDEVSIPAILPQPLPTRKLDDELRVANGDIYRRLVRHRQVHQDEAHPLGRLEALRRPHASGYVDHSCHDPAVIIAHRFADGVRGLLPERGVIGSRSGTVSWASAPVPSTRLHPATLWPLGTSKYMKPVAVVWAVVGVGSAPATFMDTTVEFPVASTTLTLLDTYTSFGLWLFSFACSLRTSFWSGLLS